MQDEREDVVFGTSVVGGFNRKNVLNYIEKLQNSLAKSGTAADEKERLLRQAQTELRDLRTHVEALQAQLDEAAAENSVLQMELDKAAADNRALETQLDAARLEARQARAEAADLRTHSPLRRKR